LSKQVKLKIDGEYVTAEAGQTVLQVARANGKFIPALCFIEGLKGLGACRLCLVEVTGIGRLLPACTTPVQDGMSIVTTSPRLAECRKMIMELLLSERNHICSVCVSNGNCELQALAAELGVTHVQFPYRYPKLPVDASHERFVIDHNRCVLCNRCVRVCREVEGANTWGLISRGVNAMVAADLNEPWGESQSCTNCGKCFEACPTGAIAMKGKAVGENAKRRDRIARLVNARGGAQ
jgi:bidirectional [NiFe] hydrogenase diaphorase subunit